MRTYKKTFASLIIGMALLFGGTAMADQIEISESCSSPDASTDNAGCDPTAGGNYGFEWTVLAEGDTSDATTTYSEFHVTLENIGSAPSQIDGFWFNLNGSHTLVGAVEDICPTLTAGQVCFDNIDPATWTITMASGGALFEYAGADDQGQGSTQDRLEAGSSLTFDILFATAETYGVFLNSDSDAGNGIGGGSESGQVCVSFQSLPDTDGNGTNQSDLLCGDYEDTPMETSEPGTLALLGLGLLGMGLARRRRTAV